MSTASNAKGNCFIFTCNCGYSRKVTDCEINFTCERPKTDRDHTGCPYFYKMTKNGTAAGIPSIKRVNAAGVDQSDNTVVSSTAGSGEHGVAGGSAPLGVAINQQHTVAHK
jgi:hypothetical protein